MTKLDKFMFAWLAAIICFYAFGPSLQAQQIQSKVISGYAGNLLFAPASIPTTTTTSVAVQLKGFSLVGIQLPAAFTGTALTFMASSDGVTYSVLKSTTSGSSLSYTVAQGNYYAIDPVAFYGVNYLKIVSGSTEAAARALVLSLKGI